ncbi:MAG TPA: hypothetical protein VN798_01560, partial [Pseudomonas sp.]|nr:hypothetical protein [Pseudomonas sp.]
MVKRENQVYDSGLPGVVASNDPGSGPVFRSRPACRRWCWSDRYRRQAGRLQGTALILFVVVVFVVTTAGKRVRKHDETMIGITVIDDPAL